jgi:hypothetical protein
MNTVSVLSCGISNLKISKPIFPLKGKSDFRSIRDVRSYALKQTALWPSCSHGEFCVMQVYQGWNNSGRRFWPVADRIKLEA